MATLNRNKQTRHDRLTVVLTEEQVSYRLENGHPNTFKFLAQQRGPNGGVFFAITPYSPGDYYLSTGNEKSKPHEPWGYPPAPVRAKGPKVRKNNKR